MIALSLLSLEPIEFDFWSKLRFTEDFKLGSQPTREAHGGLFLLESKRGNEEASKGTPIILMVLLHSIAA